jgi:hypothetical protein
MHFYIDRIRLNADAAPTIQTKMLRHAKEFGCGRAYLDHDAAEILIRKKGFVNDAVGLELCEKLADHLKDLFGSISPAFVGNSRASSGAGAEIVERTARELYREE